WFGRIWRPAGFNFWSLIRQHNRSLRRSLAHVRARCYAALVTPPRIGPESFFQKRLLCARRAVLTAGRFGALPPLETEQRKMSRRTWKQWTLQTLGLARRSQERPAGRGLTFETLSERITPAVNAFFHAGVLTVTG